MQIKSNKYFVEDFIQTYIYKNGASIKKNIKKSSFFHLLNLYDWDTLFILIHIYIKNNEHPSLICPDDILEFRKKQKIRSGKFLGGYHKKQRQIVQQSFKKLSALKLIQIEKQDDIHNFKFVINKIGAQDATIINSKFLSYNPLKAAWEKQIGCYLSIQCAKKKCNFQIQISKLLEEIYYIPKSYHPLKIREKFEQTLTNLVIEGVIQSWEYKKIDEDFLLECKNWLPYWKILSVKITQ